jgi:hypothetical protein
MTMLKPSTLTTVKPTRAAILDIRSLLEASWYGCWKKVVWLLQGRWYGCCKEGGMGRCHTCWKEGVTLAGRKVSCLLKEGDMLARRKVIACWKEGVMLAGVR